MCFADVIPARGKCHRLPIRQRHDFHLRILCRLRSRKIQFHLLHIGTQPGRIFRRPEHRENRSRNRFPCCKSASGCGKQKIPDIRDGFTVFIQQKTDHIQPVIAGCRQCRVTERLRGKENNFAFSDFVPESRRRTVRIMHRNLCSFGN